MIIKNQSIDDLIAAIKSKHEFRNVSKKELQQPYLLETNDLIEKALFLKNYPNYLYCLSQYGDFCVTTQKYSLMFFGFGAWDGSAIDDYPLLGEDGIYVFADAVSEEDEVFIFAFNTKDTTSNTVWIAREEGGDYINTYYDFNRFLECILADKFDNI